MSTTVKMTWDTGKINLLQERAVKGMVTLASDVANRARSNAPYKTGALRNSIRIEEDGTTCYVIAGGNSGGRAIKYAAIQEFGGYAGRKHTSHIIGKHYLQRAADTTLSGNYMKRYFGDIV